MRVLRRYTKLTLNLNNRILVLKVRANNPLFSPIPGAMIRATQPNPTLVQRFTDGAMPEAPTTPHCQRWHVQRLGNGQQAMWQCTFCSGTLMRVGRRHDLDHRCYYDLEPCDHAAATLEDPETLKPVPLKYTITETGIDTPPYPWPAASIDYKIGAVARGKHSKTTILGAQQKAIAERDSRQGMSATTSIPAATEAPSATSSPTRRPSPKRAPTLRRQTAPTTPRRRSHVGPETAESRSLAIEDSPTSEAVPVPVESGDSDGSWQVPSPGVTASVPDMPAEPSIMQKALQLMAREPPSVIREILATPENLERALAGLHRKRGAADTPGAASASRPRSSGSSEPVAMAAEADVNTVREFMKLMAEARRMAEGQPGLERQLQGCAQQ